MAPPANRLRRVVASSGASNLADGITKVAIPLLAVGFTRSPAAVAGIEVVRTLPWLVGALPVGALVDRLDRRHTMIVANVVRGVVVALTAALLASGLGALWLLYLVALTSGIAEVFYDTAAQSLVPSVVGRAELERANGRLFAVELGAQELAGPPVAGLLVAVGAALAFGSAAALWIVAIVVLLGVRGTFRPTRASRRTTIRGDVGEGLRFLVGQPILRTMAVMVGMGNLANSAVFAVLVIHAVGPESALGLTEPQFGLLFATLAAGALVGAMIADRARLRAGRARALTLSVVGMAANIVALAATTNVAVIATTAFMSGAAMMIWNVTTVSYRQRITPDHLLGRLNSAFRLLAWGTRPLGALLGGVLGQWLGVRAVFVVMAVVAVAVLLPDRLITDDALTRAEELV